MEILKRIWPVAALFLIITGIILTDSPEKRAASDRKAASGAASEALSEERYPMTVSFFSLDTVCTLTAYEGGGREALEEAGRELERYDRLFDPYEEGSDIYRINHREEESVRISRETGELLQFGRDLGELSGGDLDITVGNLTALWDIRHRTEAPEPEAGRMPEEDFGPKTGLALYSGQRIRSFRSIPEPLPRAMWQTG